MLKIIASLSLFAALACAQQPPIQPGVDYPSPIPVPFIGFTVGTSDPVKCVPGRSPLNYRTDQTLFHYCSARNVWSPFMIGQSCGTTATCAHTAPTAPLKFVQGTGTLVTGSPSTFALTGMSPAFTSATSYYCNANDVTAIVNNIGVLTAGYISGSAVTFTGPNANTDVFRYTCVGF